MPPALIVAGLSARMMAESALQAGMSVAALDLFGDIDTRRASHSWRAIGDAAAMAVDGERLLSALRQLRVAVRPLGWVAGSGFEHLPGLLAAGQALVPLVGNDSAVVRGVKDPHAFFGLLGAQGIAHPETSARAPREASGWLCKTVGGSGGWHIQLAAARHPGAQAPLIGAARYYQRRHRGHAMSALFLADGQAAAVVGASQQRVGAHAGGPYLFQGAAGPVPLALPVAARLQEIVCCIVREAGLVGLNSLDFLLDGSDIVVLEVNPRPSASMALYADCLPAGLMHAHLQACRGRLPAEGEWCQPAGVRGFRLVLADRTVAIDATLTATLTRAGWCHDIPTAGSCVAAGQPFCTVSAMASTLTGIDTALRRRCAQIQSLLRSRHDDPQHARHDPTGIVVGPVHRTRH
jgi:predicted ATP-grasp superfamily ATP-dependent carboligase